MGVEVDAQGEQPRFQQGLSRRQRRGAEHLNLRVIGKALPGVMLAIRGYPNSQGALRKKRQESLVYASNHQLGAILLTDELFQHLGNKGA